jgi:hypothetical protein
LLKYAQSPVVVAEALDADSQEEYAEQRRSPAAVNWASVTYVAEQLVEMQLAMAV